MFSSGAYYQGSPVIKSYEYQFNLLDVSDFYRYYLTPDPVIESKTVRNIIIFPGTVVTYAPALINQPNTNFNTYCRLTCYGQGNEDPVLNEFPFALLNPAYGLTLNAGAPGGKFPAFNFKIDLNRTYFQFSNNGFIPTGTYKLRFQFVLE